MIHANWLFLIVPSAFVAGILATWGVIHFVVLRGLPR